MSTSLAGQARRGRQWFLESNAVTAALLSGEAPAVTLRRIARELRQALHAHVVVVALPKPRDGSVLRFDVLDTEGDAEELSGIEIPDHGTATATAFTEGAAVTVRGYGRQVHAARPSGSASAGPELDSAVAAPLIAGGSSIGALTVARLTGSAPFSEGDVRVVEEFAHHAALVIEFSRAEEDSRKLAVLEDRHRIARDLHDVVVQRLYAVGLRLYALGDQIRDPSSAAQAHQLVDEIDHAIQSIRASIFALEEPPADQGGTRAHVWRVAQDFADILGFEPWVDFDGPLDAAVTGPARADLDAAVRETLTNVVKHASATSVYLGVTVDGHGRELTLTVVDNGTGMPLGASRRSGLANLEARAGRWKGTLAVQSERGHGTKVVWRIVLPLDDRQPNRGSAS